MAIFDSIPIIFSQILHLQSLGSTTFPLGHNFGGQTQSHVSGLKTLPFPEALHLSTNIS